MTIDEHRIVHTFVSMPDFLNTDIGDLRYLSNWQTGMPNSWNPSYAFSIARILDAVADENPDHVFVAGDLVEGHWGEDIDGTGIFGPVETTEQQRAAICRAGNFYYKTWLDRFNERGLHVYPAIGDHEIGDNPFDRPELISSFKDVWADHFTGPEDDPYFTTRPVGTAWKRTAYAQRLNAQTLLVSVDVFSMQTPDGQVRATVHEGQLDWFKNVLERATAPTVIVQGHTPIVGPVRRAHSSGLMLDDARDSGLWGAMIRYGVDLYLCGEVHAVTATNIEGLTQIAHGNIVPRGANYLLGKVYNDNSMDLTIKRVILTERGEGELWQTSGKRPTDYVNYEHGSHVAGEAKLTSDGRFVDRTGLLAPYYPEG